MQKNEDYEGRYGQKLSWFPSRMSLTAEKELREDKSTF